MKIAPIDLLDRQKIEELFLNDDVSMSKGQRAMKRIVDIIISLTAMIILSPVIAIVAIWIRLGSKGAAIFKQQRVGKDGDLFTMYKFRTMVDGAEQIQPLNGENGTFLKTKNDPRVTYVGRSLRRYSLDELPQFWNVLRGDMSMVGPRPELPSIVDTYEDWQYERFRVPQGMTGWWQINGRSDKPMHLYTEYDIYYIRKFSVRLDLYILYKTGAIVLGGRGAF